MRPAAASLSSPADAEIEGIISLINNGDARALGEMSAPSFLLDTEILHGKALTDAFWNGMAGSGLDIAGAEVTRSKAAVKSDAELFGEGDDVRVFFETYLPAGAFLTELGTGEGRIIILTGSRRFRLARSSRMGRALLMKKNLAFITAALRSLRRSIRTGI